MSRLMAFVDGENLTARFETMLHEGRRPRVTNHAHLAFGPVAHEMGLFAWSPATVSGFPGDEEVLRIHYYTTFSGGADKLEEFRKRVATHKALWLQDDLMVPRRTLPLIPRVFHKTARNTKTKSVDINLCVEVLEYVRQNALDSVFLVTGDVDYLPLIDAAMKAGKRVYVAALSSGLSSQLMYGVDQFISLDDRYFEG